MSYNFPLKTATGRAKAPARIAVRAEVVPDRHCVDRVELTLPVPPSSNGLFANRAGGGRFRTKPYEAWIAEAGWNIVIQKPGRIAGPYEIEIAIPLPSGKRVMDLGNREKAISDILVKHGVVGDDSLAQRITLTWTSAESAVVVLTKARE